MNCLLETSGRDVSMFTYIQHYFSATAVPYKKLVLHFVIQDLEHAKKSVDRRMVQEIKNGIAALSGNDNDNVQEIINVNAGGPYGSNVLSSVQEASDKVWNEIILNKKQDIGNDWYKATISIQPHATEPWTACAVRNDGTLGKKFT
eukprot:CAMPEP_0116845668 /NCGR_PEP_ID=MMETSP0418-20121206/13400_1 /TAXON_ID=1158023 /ORGANISM="Astrosyne radiata, Strain 13vi08-1A" /LENGTH=145 /DNA_ID=CAMNT_0004476815 /DNA_START=154 /DNA_END=587 /DNA_ORIENTATION=-